MGTRHLAGWHNESTEVEKITKIVQSQLRLKPVKYWPEILQACSAGVKQKAKGKATKPQLTIRKFIKYTSRQD